MSTASDGTPAGHSGSFRGCGGNPVGISNCKGGGNCGNYCRSCGAHTHWSCCGSTDPGSTHCLSHVSAEQAVLNKDAVFGQQQVPIQVCRIPGVQYGCPHPGSFPGCGGNPDGISNCRGGGNCGPNCRACGARTHWSCCGSIEASSTHCLPHVTPGQALKNKALVFAAQPTPIQVRVIPGVNFGSGQLHKYERDSCKICSECGVCTGYGSNCVKCRSLDRSGDKGQLCGCGVGPSGCSRCGKCEACGGAGYNCTAVAAPINLPGTTEAIHSQNGSHSSSLAPTPVSAATEPIAPSAPPLFVPPQPPGLAPPPGLEDFVDEWFYTDAQQNVQGPFPTRMMREWYQSGYLTSQLPIKMKNWASFHPLWNVFPRMADAFTTYVVREPVAPP